MGEPLPNGADDTYRVAEQSTSEHESEALTAKQRALVHEIRMLIELFDERADRHKAYKRTLNQDVFFWEASTSAPRD